MKRLQDTITAISTPLGRGGIGIIRISGPEAINIGKSMFRPAREKLVRERRLSFGQVIGKKGEIIDQAMAVFIKGPYTYTGDDTYELQAHGGNLVLERILKLCLEAGARMAEPGEFTYRAFMAGKVDLSQAEGVIELINAKTGTGSKIAVKQILGSLNSKISKLTGELVRIYAEYEAGIDFLEEKENIDEREIYSRLYKNNKIIDELLKESELARRVKNGVRIVIAGRVNAGKSSLLNMLCKYNRAITSETPGTTRDYLEETIELEGVEATFIDTAGFREGNESDRIERSGQQLSRELVKESDYIVYLIDSVTGMEKEDMEIIQSSGKERTILAYNKIDLNERKVVKEPNEVKDYSKVYISAKTGQGLEQLKSIIIGRIKGNNNQLENLNFLPNDRQIVALKNAGESVENAMRSVEEGMDREAILVDLKEALEQLGFITGEGMEEKVLDEIFSQFCIGK